MISTRKHQFRVHRLQDMSQNTIVLALFGQTWDGSINEKKTAFGGLWVLLWIKNTQKMWFAPSDKLFGCMVHVLLGKLGMDPDRVRLTQMCVSELWLEIFHVQKYYDLNSTLLLVLILYQTKLFFVTFSNLKFFCDFQKWPSRAWAGHLLNHLDPFRVQNGFLESGI